jgi:hypothetical protein
MAFTQAAITTIAPIENAITSEITTIRSSGVFDFGTLHHQ